MDQGDAVTHAEAALPPLPAGVLCPRCAYDLRGLTSRRCPECGLDLTALREGATRIPWALRKDLGRWRAYWRTVRQVLRRPRDFCLEIARPVSYADSQSFRWITTALGYLTFMAALVIGVLPDWPGSQPPACVWDYAATAVWAGLVLVLIPGLVSDFFHPSDLPVEHQNRAIALSYYAWAPLALTPLAIPFWLARLMLEWADQEMAAMTLGLLGLLLVVILWLLCAWRVVQFGKYTLHKPFGQRLRWVITLGLAVLVVLVALRIARLAILYIVIIIQTIW